jgi:hypothetical protein
MDQRTWGLDPYFFENGTITGGAGNIAAGQRQGLAYLIGGHDAGEGAYAALMAYLETQNPKYLQIFNVYRHYFQGAQIPGPSTTTPATTILSVGNKSATIDDAGYWAEQASVSAGDNGTYGSPNDTTNLQAIYPAAEHGNPIAIALIAYYRTTHDASTLAMLNRYGSWLVKTQIHTGNYTGAFPVTQYYYALGWKPRMYETTESAWVLAELYLITGNQTYLDSAKAAGQYMLSKQLIGPEWRGTAVYGALPYEWNETHYTYSVSTNHAGFSIIAWSNLFQITGDQRYLNAATTYANWLLNFQVTNPGTTWGNHTYANDSMAPGGYYYGYFTAKHEFGWRVAESLWSAAYAIPALLVLSQITGNETFRDSATLAAEWLQKMRYPDQSPIPLQALAIMKYPVSSWWGLYPQYYQPDMTQITQAGIESFVKQGRTNESSIKNTHPTWFERTFSVDFNIIDYEMASRGPTYMKMVWSWWPDIGFEPRYGGDIAFGAFAADGYLTFNSTLLQATQTLEEIETLTNNDTSSLPGNATATYNEAKTLASDAADNYRLGWYPIASAQSRTAAARAETVLNYLELTLPAKQTTQILQLIVTSVVAIFLLSNLYWHRKLSRLKRERRREPQRRQRTRRTRRTLPK